MRTFIRRNRITFFFFLFVFSHNAHNCLSAESAFELDIKELDKEQGTPPKQAKKAAKQKLPVISRRLKSPKTAQTHKAVGNRVIYTVKRGDHIFKILVKEFGISNSDAELLVPVVMSLNNIQDIRKLTVGQNLLIPVVAQQTKIALPPVEPLPAAPSGVTDTPSQNKAPSTTAAAQPLAAGNTPKAVSNSLTKLQKLWQELIPNRKLPDPFIIGGKPVDIDHDTLFPALDGSAIVVDPQNKLTTAFVDKELQANGVRVVTVSPNNPKQLMAELLKSAGFTGVQENPVLSFGIEPKLSISADFGIVPNQSETNSAVVTLLNVDQAGRCLPSRMLSFLKEKQIVAHELCTPNQPTTDLQPLEIYSITTIDPSEIIDSLLEAFRLQWSRNHIIETPAGNNGSIFSVKVDRYFEYRGKRVIVNLTEGDPFNYTLLRLLEGAGYHVFSISAGDDVVKITGKLLTTLELSPNYGQHVLLCPSSDRIKLEATGFLLSGNALAGKQVLITRMTVDDFLRDLMKGN